MPPVYSENVTNSSCVQSLSLAWMGDCALGLSSQVLPRLNGSGSLGSQDPRHTYPAVQVPSSASAVEARSAGLWEQDRA